MSRVVLRGDSCACKLAMGLRDNVVLCSHFPRKLLYTVDYLSPHGEVGVTSVYVPHCETNAVHAMHGAYSWSGMSLPQERMHQPPLQGVPVEGSSSTCPVDMRQWCTFHAQPVRQYCML